jgi:hypothetical protein
MKRKRYWIALLGMVGLPGLVLGEARTAGFEDVVSGEAPLVGYTGPGGGRYYNGADGAGGFTSGGVFFPNTYNAEWMSWSGWSVSTTVDTATAGFGNQYSSFAGGAATGEAYAVAYAPARLELPAGWRAPERILVSNTTYAALAMRDGDAFARQFGDDPATPETVETDYPDYLKLTISGLTAAGDPIGEVEVYLADYRGSPEEDYILEGWVEVDLDPVVTNGWGQVMSVAALEFRLESTDVGDFGMNTPSYLAIDDLVIRETTSWGPYDFGPHGPDWVNTGDFLGWIYPESDHVYLLALEKWVYLREEEAAAETGSWIYLPR